MIKKQQRKRLGFTLVEVLIVVVIMAILAATIIPQFADSTKDAKISTVVFNLHTLRSQIEVYKSHHDGKLPSATLAELTVKTDVTGASTGAGPFPYGPYVHEIPSNPFNNSQTVTSVASDPITSSDVTGTGGWLFNATTGEIRIDHADYVSE